MRAGLTGHGGRLLGRGGLVTTLALLIGAVAWALLGGYWQLPGTARLSADPNPVPAGPELGSTVISWAGPAGSVAQIYVSVDGQPEQLLAEGSSGLAEAPWIVTGHQYDFRLYSGVDHRALLSTVQVSRSAAGPGIEIPLWPGSLALLFAAATGLAGWVLRKPSRTPPVVADRVTKPRGLIVRMAVGTHAALTVSALLVYVGAWLMTLGRSDPTPPSFNALSALFMAATAVAILLGLFWCGRFLLALLLALPCGLLVVILLRTDNGPALAVLAWLVLVSLGLGQVSLRLIARSIELSALERSALSLLLGFAGLALLSNSLGLFGQLRPLPVAAALVVLSLPMAQQLLRWRASIGRIATVSAWARTDLRRPAFGIAALSLPYWGGLLWALAPSVHPDARAYHLPIAAADAASGGLVDLPCWAATHVLGLPHALYALTFVLGGQPLPGLLSFTFGLIATALTFALADRLGGRLAAWVAAAGFASAPVVSWLAGTAYVDLFAAAYLVGCLYALARWQADDRVRWLTLAGLLGGLSLGTKQTPLLYVALVTLPLIWTCLHRYPTAGQACLRLTSFGVPLMLAPLPWLARNVLIAGDPYVEWCPQTFATQLTVSRLLRGALEPPRALSLLVLGLLFVGLAIGVGWLLARRGARWCVWAPRLAWTMIPLGLLVAGGAGALLLPHVPAVRGAAVWFGTPSPLDFVQLPLDLIVNGQEYPPMVSAGPLGVAPTLLLLAPLGWPWRTHPERAGGLLVALAGTVIWFMLVRDTRYLLPILPLVCVLAALSLTSLRLPARAPNALAMLPIALGGLYLVAELGLGVRWHSELPETYPYRLALGLETGEQFLERSVDVYPAYRFIDQQTDRPGAVLALGWPPRFYLSSPNATDGELRYWPPYDRLANSPWLGRGLQELGYRRLVVDWQNLNTSPESKDNPRLPPAELRAFARLEFVHGVFAVYRLEDERVVTAEPGPNLLRNGGFDQAAGDQTPPGWSAEHSPTIINDAAAALRTAPFVAVTNDDIYFQTFPTSPGQLYTLRLVARADRGVRFGWLEVYWLDDTLRVLEPSRLPYRVGARWRRLEAPLVAPAGAAFGRVNIRAAPGTTVWVDDVSLVEE